MSGCNLMNVETDDYFDNQFKVQLLNASRDLALSKHFKNKADKITLEIKHPKKGVYLIMIRDNQSTMTQKVIIK